MPEITRCRSCGASIVWYLTERGHRMPVDELPRADGNLVLRDGVAIVATESMPGEPRYVSHFATCQQAKAWRRR